jgi:hypothetical protein
MPAAQLAACLQDHAHAFQIVCGAPGAALSKAQACDYMDGLRRCAVMRQACSAACGKRCEACSCVVGGEAFVVSGELRNVLLRPSRRAACGL